MPYPSGLPVDEQIMAALKTRFESITGSPNYYNHVLRVERYQPGNLQVIREFPAIVLGQPQIATEQTVAGRISNDLEVIVRGALSDRETFSTSISKLSADIRRALYSDIQLGGVACWTRIKSEERYELIAENAVLAAVDVVLTVHYRHLLDDPNTPA